jgi:hypothetical protein
MRKNAPIIAYGHDEDRLRLAAVASAHSKSGSQWIIDQIRQRYAEMFGDTPPEVVTAKL